MKETAMRKKNLFSLTIVILLVLLSLISCTTNSITSMPTSTLPNILSTTPAPTLVNLITTYTPSPTSIPSNLILPSPTEVVSPILGGRVLFEGDAIKNGVKSHGIVLLDLKTNETTLVFEPKQKVNGQSVSLYYPIITWSPDGHWFAFVGTDVRANVSGFGFQDIYIANSDGTEIRQLTNSPQYQKFSISWSPDEKNLLVAMGISGSDLYLINASDGEIIERLTSSGSVYSAAWSPDGNKIAYSEYSGLSIMNMLDKTTQRFSIPSNNSAEDISWAPDSNRIAFVSSVNASSCTDIFITNINTNGTINITSSNYHEKSPNWLPDGKYLAFSRSAYLCGSEGISLDIFITNFMHEESRIISAGYWTSVALAPVPSLAINKQYTITELGAFLNLRTEPSLSGQILEKLPAGEVITVLDGFVDADDYYWWKIQTQDGIEGWAVEVANWYKPLNE